MERAVVMAKLPCGVTVNRCTAPAIGRVHDAEDSGAWSVYSCESHLRFAIKNVHREGYEAAVTRFYTAGQKVTAHAGSVRLKRAEETLELLIEELRAAATVTDDADRTEGAVAEFAQALLEKIQTSKVDEGVKIRGKYRAAHRAMVQAVEERLRMEMRPPTTGTGTETTQQVYDQARSDLARELMNCTASWRNPAV